MHVEVVYLIVDDMWTGFTARYSGFGTHDFSNGVPPIDPCLPSRHNPFGALARWGRQSHPNTPVSFSLYPWSLGNGQGPPVGEIEPVLPCLYFTPKLGDLEVSHL